MREQETAMLVQSTALLKNQEPALPVETLEQHSLMHSILLHLLPGVFIVALFVAAAPPVMQAGYPPLLAMAVAGVGGGLAFQLADLFYQGKRKNGKWSLERIVLFCQSVPVRDYLLLVPLFTLAAFLIYGLTIPVGAYLLGLIPWLPQWFEMRDVALLAQYSRSSLVTTFWLSLALNGIAAPIVEEMYFRGYLMPRLSRFGRLTPIIEVALFTLYHFWQPYFWVTQFLSMLPVVVAVWWRRSIKLGILTHAAMNIIGLILTFGQILG
jgi:membrane protease YdiL (CAAX protease family)